jgi:hypothetical protein
MGLAGAQVTYASTAATQSHVVSVMKAQYRGSLLADKPQLQSISVHHRLNSKRRVVNIAHLEIYA